MTNLTDGRLADQGLGNGSMSGSSLDELHREWLTRPGYKAEYEALGEEFAIAAALIDARARAGLTQEEVAGRMNTTQTVIARLESGRTKPSTRTLERFATATGMRLRVSFEPDPRARKRESADRR